jgi:hypothetical protein
MSLHKNLTRKYKFSDSIKDIILQEGHVDNTLTLKDIELLAAKCYARENYMIKKVMTDMNKVQIFDVFKSKQLLDYTEEELKNLAYAIKYNFSEDLIVDYLNFLVDNEFFPNRTYFNTPVNTSIVLDFIKSFDDKQISFRYGIDIKIKEKQDTTPHEEMAPKEMFDAWIKNRAKGVVFHLTKNNELYLCPKANFNFNEKEFKDKDKITFTDIITGYLTELNFEKIEDTKYKYNGTLDYFQLYFELVSRGLECNFIFSKYIMENFENYK